MTTTTTQKNVTTTTTTTTQTKCNDDDNDPQSQAGVEHASICKKTYGVVLKKNKNTHQQPACKIINYNNLHVILQSFAFDIWTTLHHTHKLWKTGTGKRVWMNECMCCVFRLFIMYFQTTVILGIEMILLCKFVQVVTRDAYIFLRLLIIIIFQ